MLRPSRWWCCSAAVSMARHHRISSSMMRVRTLALVAIEKLRSAFRTSLSGDRVRSKSLARSTMHAHHSSGSMVYLSLWIVLICVYIHTTIIIVTISYFIIFFSISFAREREREALGVRYLCQIFSIVRVYLSCESERERAAYTSPYPLLWILLLWEPSTAPTLIHSARM